MCGASDTRQRSTCQHVQCGNPGQWSLQSGLLSTQVTITHCNVQTVDTFDAAQLQEEATTAAQVHHQDLSESEPQTGPQDQQQFTGSGHIPGGDPATLQPVPPQQRAGQQHRPVLPGPLRAGPHPTPGPETRGGGAGVIQ